VAAILGISSIAVQALALAALWISEPRPWRLSLVLVGAAGGVLLAASGLLVSFVRRDQGWVLSVISLAAVVPIYLLLVGLFVLTHQD
jgi:hypothetical protein